MMMMSWPKKIKYFLTKNEKVNSISFFNLANVFIIFGQAQPEHPS